MSDLTPAAKELVRAGRAASRATLADRERVLSALQHRIADPSILHAPASPPTSLLGKGWLAWSGAGLAVLCGLGAVLLVATRTEPSPPTPALASAVPAASSAALRQTSTLELPAPTASNSGARKPDSSARSGAVVSDRLAEEVAILSRAEADLHRGQAGQALRSLDEHQRSFPKGALTLERRAARARALCALGREREAQAELTRLARLAAGSPLERRAREACTARAQKKH